jgi:hypothetical protein
MCNCPACQTSHAPLALLEQHPLPGGCSHLPHLVKPLMPLSLSWSNTPSLLDVHTSHTCMSSNGRAAWLAACKTGPHKDGMNGLSQRVTMSSSYLGEKTLHTFSSARLASHLILRPSGFTPFPPPVWLQGGTRSQCSAQSPVRRGQQMRWYCSPTPAPSRGGQRSGTDKLP